MEEQHQSRPVHKRSALISRCRLDLESRRRGYLSELESLDAAAAGETKSSAGDKYETAREMIAQSRNLIARTLAETEAALQALERMAAGKPGGDTEAEPGGRVMFGSLIETSRGWYLAGVSLGEVETESGNVNTLTLASPLGQALKGKSAGDRVPWRGGNLEIVRVIN